MSDGRRGLFGLFKKNDSSDPEPAASDPATPTLTEMQRRIADFERARVEDVMIPRSEMIAVELTTSLDDLIKLYAEEAHSRLPVYRETLDDPVGVVHIRDVMAEIARANGTAPEADDAPLERLRRDILFVPPSMPLPDLLVKMQTSRTHLALVVDEYGGTDGLVSLEDLVEEIVGDIEDEHDE
ncbi:MAG: CBS domain-containing protein, partial [Pseudomonadota bacterium]